MKINDHCAFNIVVNMRVTRTYVIIDLDWNSFAGFAVIIKNMITNPIHKVNNQCNHKYTLFQ